MPYARCQVLTKPEARRQDAKPVLRNYAKFPAISLHLPPTLVPWTQLLTGTEAVEQLLSAVAAASSGIAPELPVRGARSENAIGELPRSSILWSPCIPSASNPVPVPFCLILTPRKSSYRDCIGNKYANPLSSKSKGV